MYCNTLLYSGSNSIPIPSLQCMWYSLYLPTLVWWVHPWLVGRCKVMELSKSKWLLGDYNQPLRDYTRPQKWSTMQCKQITCPGHIPFISQIWSNPATFGSGSTKWSALHLTQDPAMLPQSGLKCSAINTSKLLDSLLVGYFGKK